MHNCTTAQLHNCTTAQLHNCTTAQLHNCTTAQLHNCTTAQLHNCTTAEQQRFLKKLEADLWDSANKLLPHLDAANYKHVALGLVFLKYVSDAFESQRAKILAEIENPDSEFYLPKDAFENPQEYDQACQFSLESRDSYTQDNVLWIPPEARWSNVQKLASLPIGSELPWGDKFRGVANLIDNAFVAIGRENAKLKGVANNISQYNIDEQKLIELINLFSNTQFYAPTLDGKPIHLAAKDILGHIYEYFLGQFALAEGKKGGQYFTPKAIVTLIVEMLQPFKGRIYDPAMGSGGFFVQAERFVQAHQGRIDDVSIFGQESNRTTRNLAIMNMVIRGIGFDFGNENADTMVNPLHLDKKMDFVMANPPFNMKSWWHESLAQDARWQYGTPPAGNANFAWLQHMLYHLNDKGKMALLLANGSMSSQTNGEGDIRRNLIQADLVEAMVALPNQLFTNTQIPACIWILNKAKPRKGEVLFIDARKMGYMKDRVLRDFTAEDIAQIADTYHQWQQSQDYQDQAAYCYSASLSEIAQNDFVLTPGRYVGAEEIEEDSEPFAEKMQKLTALLNQQFAQGAELEAKIKASLGGLGYE